MSSNRRRQFLLGAAILFAVGPVFPQRSQRAARLGVLTTLAPVPQSFWEPFMSTLSARGWIEGRNLTVEQRGTAGKPANALALAKELINLRVDLILGLATISALAARRASASVPVVTLAGYPVDAGLASSLARPGGNITGIAAYASREVWGKLVAFLRELRPSLRQVGILWDYVEPGFPDGEIPIPELAQAAQRLGIGMSVWKLRSQEDLERALRAVVSGGIEALVISSAGGIVNGPASTRKIAQFVREYRLPAITDIAGGVFRNAGCVLAYSPDVQEISRRLADFVDRILRGAKPAELPFELPSRFELAVHLGNAKAIDLKVPPALLARADQLLE